MTDPIHSSNDTVTGYAIVQLAPHLAAARSATLQEALSSVPLRTFVRLLDEFGSPPSRRLIQSISVDELLELEARAARGPFPPLSSLANFWRVDLRASIGALPHFVARVRELPEVVSAYVETSFGPAGTVNPGGNPLYSQQGHLRPAPTGIDAPFAWSQQGGDGSGVAVMDIEQGWNFDHEDLVLQRGTLRYGKAATDFTNVNHGTAVLGTILASDNQLGGIGVAPGVSEVNTVSYIEANGSGINVSDAIISAVKFISPGDILVIEAQTLSTNPSCLPSEVREPEFTATRLAVASGIIVVAAGGNGQHDLDAYVDPSGARIFNRNDPGFRDSGAIMVGGCLAACPHGRGVSNYGSRIDCYAWGEKVVTTAYGGLGGYSANQWYGYFDGTSSATAIIAGAALCVQGVAQAGPGRLTPMQMRAALSNPATGTASASASDRIGVMPDLRRVLAPARFVSRPTVPAAAFRERA